MAYGIYALGVGASNPALKYIYVFLLESMLKLYPLKGLQDKMLLEWNDIIYL